MINVIKMPKLSDYLVPVLPHTGRSINAYDDAMEVWRKSVLFDDQSTNGAILEIGTATPATAEQEIGAPQYHSLLDANLHTDTVLHPPSRGDIVVANDTPLWDALAIGVTGYFLRSDGTDPSWQPITVDDVTLPEALTANSDANVTIALGGSPLVALLAATSITLGWTGVLSLLRGGTNEALTAVAGAVVWCDADSFGLTAVGTAGQVLVAQGTASPIWQDASVATAHTILSATHTDTLAASVLRGDIITGQAATPKWTRLAVGVEGQTILKNNAVDVFWGQVDLSSADVTGILFVNRGGTGNNAFTPFAVVCGGITTTDPLQTVFGLGTVGQVLTSNDVGALPTWQSLPSAAHTLLNATSHTDSVTQTVSVGSLIYGNATPKWDELLIGAAATYLRSNGTVPSWQTIAAADVTGLAHNLLSATHSDTLAGGTVVQGALIIGNATPKWDVLPPASVGGKFLRATGALNANWSTLVFINASARGDLVKGSSVANTIDVLAIGTTGKFLKSDGSDPSWQNITVTDIGSGAALTRVNGTNVTLTLGGSPTTALLAATSITVGWTGQLAIADGGTGQATALAAFNALSPLTTFGDLLSRDATNNVRIGIGTAGFVLTSNGAGALPTWQSLPASDTHNLLSATHTDTLAASVIAGDLIYGNATPKWARLAHSGEAGEVLTTTSATEIGWQAPTTQFHNLLSTTHLDTTAASVVRGDLVTGQTATPKWQRLAFGPAFTVLRTAAGTEPSWGKVDLEIDVENFLHIENGGTRSTSALVNNRVMVSSFGAIKESVGLETDFYANLYVIPDAISNGSPAPVAFTVTGAAHTLLDSSAEAVDIHLNMGRTVTFGGGTPISTQRAMIIAAPTYAFGVATTISKAATLAIDDAPQPGLNATITNAYALWVQAGITKLDGKAGIGNVAPTAQLHLRAGQAGATLAPLKFNSGTNLTAPEAGAVEWDGSRLYITQTSGPTRQTIAYLTDLVTAAPVDATFVTLSTNATLTNERVLTGTANQIVITDGGAGAAVTLSTPQNIHATATPTFAGLSLAGLTDTGVVFASGGTGVLTTNIALASLDYGDSGYLILGAGLESPAIRHTGLTPGSLVFVSGGNFLFEDNANLFWDDTANNLYVTNINVVTTASLAGHLNTLAFTPVQITSDQNDYALATGTFFRLSTDASRTITGLTGGTDGKWMVIANVGSFNLVLANQNASSTTTNRIITGTGASITIAPDEQVRLIYDSTTGRWRCGPKVFTAGAGGTHNLLSATHPDTTAAAAVRGDIITSQGASPLWTRLAIGSAGKLLRSDGTDANWEQAVLTSDVTGILPVANGGTGVSGFTQGSVIFMGATTLKEDNANFFWDDTLNMLVLNQASSTGIALKIIKADHTSTAASAFSCIDDTPQETVGFSSWTGGGGTGGYGAFVLGGTATGTGHRFGEISGRENATATRCFSIIFQRGTAANSGDMLCYGIISGAFNIGLMVSSFGRVSIRTATAATAHLMIAAGSATASTAPLKFTSGTLNTVAEAGAVEFLTDKGYLTITTGAARKELALNDIALTSGRGVFTTTNGRLTDSSTWTYSVTAGMVIAPSAASSGANSLLVLTGAAHTAQTAGAEVIDVNVNLARVLQHASNTAVTTQRAFVIQAPTYSFASATGTITDAATLAVTAAPVVGTNAAITNPYAFWAQAGNVLFGTASVATSILKFAHASSANLTGIQAGNATAAVTYTLPTADGSAGMILSTNGSAALSWIATARVLFDHYADVLNASAGENDLYSDSIAANTLNANGQKLWARYALIFAASDARVRVYFGGAVIFDANTISTTGPQRMEIFVTIIRENSTTIRHVVGMISSGLSIPEMVSCDAVGSLTFSGAITLKLTGESTGTNNIVAKLATVGFEPAA